jgi:hypothetical protein
MADIQRSSKLAMLSLRPWHLALVTQLLALQALAEVKSASVCAVDGRFSPNTDSSPITNDVASAQVVRPSALAERVLVKHSHARSLNNECRSFIRRNP